MEFEWVEYLLISFLIVRVICGIIAYEEFGEFIGRTILGICIIGVLVLVYVIVNLIFISR